MNQDKNLRRKEKEVNAPFQRDVRLGFLAFFPHLPGLGTGIELRWLAPPMAEF